MQHVFYLYNQNNIAKEFTHYTNTSHSIMLKCRKGESDEEGITLFNEQLGDKLKNKNGHKTVVEPLPAINGANSSLKDGNSRVLLL